MVYFFAKCNIIVLDNKKTKGRINMRKTSEQLVKSIIKEYEKELVRDLNKNLAPVGVQQHLNGFTVVIKIDKPDSWCISDFHVLEVQTYKTYGSAKKLANEVYKMILMELEDQLGYYEKY